MRFAKVVFWIAGIWGVLVITPLFFMLDTVGRQTPPPVTHIDFYFGFAIVTLMWQVAFFVIALDPARYRALMIPPALAKLGYAAMLAVLHINGLVNGGMLLFASTDTLLAFLFLVAFVATRPRNQRSGLVRE